MDVTPEAQAAAAEQRAYDRITRWVASGIAILLVLGAFGLGRWYQTSQHGPVLRDDFKPSPTTPVTVYCGPGDPTP